MSGPTLCLNMIVKNESKIITRLLTSVLPIINSYCICDTGSTDNTVELIETFFKESNIPGKIVYEPFKNFAHNRNFALKSCIGMSDFVLLLDADMILDIRGFNKDKLVNHDSFYILQGNEEFYYQNVRIVRNNGLYNYAGVTHEYINTPPNNRYTMFEKNELFIIDVGDGGAKSDKFVRDIRLLTQGLIDEPNNERYFFYLANSYHDHGDFEKAIESYEKRIECGGWNQEVWFSYYKIGHCYKKMGRINDAICYWLLSIEIIPERLETIYEIIHHYRNEGKNKLVGHFYKTAKEVLDKKIFRDDYLFLYNDVYTYKIYYEYSVAAYYLGVKNINYEIVQILNNSNDGNMNNNLLQNMKFYKDVLVPKHIYVFDNKMNVEINGENTEFNSSSSCLIHKKQNESASNNYNECKYLMNIRFVNYYITENGSYINCEKNIITANKFVELDKDFKVINIKCFDIDFDGRKYIGTEDVKIFNDVISNDILFIGTGLHKNNFLGVVSGKYDVSNKTNKISPIEIMQRFNETQCEKNWVYVDYNNSTHIVYKWYPLQMCKLIDDTKTLELVKNIEMPNIFRHVRGSSCGFKYSKKMTNNNGNISITYEENEIWFVGHLVSYESPRHYYHIISVFDENMQLLRYSAPFKFEGEPIEYSLSIVVEDDNVLLNYSTWDRSTKIGVYDKDYIEGLLKYMPLKK
jgi:tetratricopeptide (TPR) repeat protein